MSKPRARDLGLPFPGTPGPLNAITDVPGLQVGFCTLTDPARNIRTGVTAVLPFPGHDPHAAAAGFYSLNGNGEMTGIHWIAHAGQFLGPILITNTHAIGACHTGATRWMIDTYADHFAGMAWGMPVVAETYDGMLNDINAMHVQPDHALQALADLKPGPVAEGAVGGGNGMIAYEFKAGTGTSSRRVTIAGETYTVGVLVQANHGRRPWLNILGQPVGRLMPEGSFRDTDLGSVITLVATDAPLSPLYLQALARRASLGVGRGGTPGGNSSGDLFLAFSVADPGPLPQHDGPILTKRELNGERIDPVYLAAVEATEEAIVNALVAADPTPAFRPAGLVVPAIDTARLKALFAKP
jgi:L-aminopeptidase/D-esterase-like protein